MTRAAPNPTPVDDLSRSLNSSLEMALAQGDTETASLIMDRLDQLDARRRKDERVAASNADREKRRSAAITRNIAREAVAAAKKRAIAQGLPVTSARISPDDLTQARAVVQNRIGRALSPTEISTSQSLAEARVPALVGSAGASPVPPPAQTPGPIYWNPPPDPASVRNGFAGLDDPNAATTPYAQSANIPALPQVGRISPVPASVDANTLRAEEYRRNQLR